MGLMKAPVKLSYSPAKFDRLILICLSDSCRIATRLNLSLPELGLRVRR
jgi:hypothetical protein